MANMACHNVTLGEYWMPRRRDEGPNPEILTEIGVEVSKGALLKAALELDVFSRIAAGQHTLPALLKATLWNERGTRILLDALANVGLLNKTESEYLLSPTVEAFLVRGKSSFLGESFIALTLNWEARGQIAKAVRTGKGLRAIFAEQNADLWAALSSAALVTWEKDLEHANALWDKILPTPDTIRTGSPATGVRLLDIGCGSGYKSFALLRRDVTARAALLDFAPVLAVAEQLANTLGVRERVEFRAGDFHTLDWGRQSFDLVLLSHITQFLSTERNIGLLRRAYEALVWEGRVVIQTVIANDERKGPGLAPLYGLETLLWSMAGDVYTVTEYRGMLEAAGFYQVQEYADASGLMSAARLPPPPPPPPSATIAPDD
jgi:SAM-dependent methyltransferase